MSADKDSSLRITPLGDHLIVKAIDEPGGERPPHAGDDAERPRKGKVLAVGDLHHDEPGDEGPTLDLKAGDEVLYSKYGGVELDVDGESILVLGLDDVVQPANDQAPAQPVQGGTPRATDAESAEAPERSGPAASRREATRALRDLELVAFRAQGDAAKARLERGLARLRELAR